MWREQVLLREIPRPRFGGNPARRLRRSTLDKLVWRFEFGAFQQWMLRRGENVHRVQESSGWQVLPKSHGVPNNVDVRSRSNVDVGLNVDLKTGMFEHLSAAVGESVPAFPVMQSHRVHMLVFEMVFHSGVFRGRLGGSLVGLNLAPPHLRSRVCSARNSTLLTSH